jgi:hypothetical protein
VGAARVQRHCTRGSLVLLSFAKAEASGGHAEGSISEAGQATAGCRGMPSCWFALQ